MDSLRHVFDPPGISRSRLEKEFIKYFPDFSSDKTNRSREAVESRAELSRQVREKMLTNRVKSAQYKASSTTQEPKVGASLEYPYDRFLRASDDLKDVEYNRELVKASEDPDTMKRGDFLFQEFMRCSRDLGIRTPEDMAKLLKRSDRELVEQFDRITRYLTLAEAMNRSKSLLTTQQQQEIRALVKQSIYDQQYYMARMSLVANPLYVEYGADLFQNRNTAPAAFGLGSQARTNPSMAKVSSFFRMIKLINDRRAENLKEEFFQMDPSLKNAVLSVEEGAIGNKTADLFRDSIPVWAFTEEGNIKVLVPDHPVKIVAGDTYMENLSVLAARTNKGMITGSRAFAKMEKALRAMEEFCRKKPGDTERERIEYWDQYVAHNNSLLKAAKGYLNYKGIGEPYSADRTAARGKNRREQSRLEVARSILDMALGQRQVFEVRMGREIDLGNEEMLEDLKAPKGFLDDDENPGLYAGNKEGDVEEAFRRDKELYGDFDEGVEKTRQELLTVYRADQAKARLQRYASGGVDPKPDAYNGDTARVADDLNILVFQHALDLEDKWVEGDDGVLRTMLGELGYDETLRQFSTMDTTPKAFEAAGLKDLTPEGIKTFLEQSGCKKVAQTLMTGQEQPPQAEKSDELVSVKGSEGKELNPPGQTGPVMGHI